MIDGEHVGDVLRTLGPKLVRLETANERVGPSVATDRCQVGQVCDRRAGGGILERLEGRIRLEGLSHVLAELRTHPVRGQAANERRVGVLMAADSREQGSNAP